MNNLKTKEKFRNINDNHVKRLEGLVNVDISIGIIDQKYSFVIRGKTNRTKFHSSKFVSIMKKVLDDKRIQLIFSLEDNAFLDIFIKLIDDIYDTLKMNDEDPVNVVYNRWLLWKELFSSRNLNLLDEHEVRGIIGELIFLRMILDKLDDDRKAILSWGGAEFDKKDFEFDNKWYEIKTSLSKNEIKISSLEQLCSKYEGYLVFIILEKTTSQNENSINLNKIVKEIIDCLKEANMIDVFTNKLNKLGYLYNDLYNNYNYVSVDVNYFLVNDLFPKITLKNVPHGIIEAKYTLDKNCLNNFKIDGDEVKFNGK